LPTEPAEKAKGENIGSPVLNAKKDVEDKEDESKEREADIYSEAVLACESTFANPIVDTMLTHTFQAALRTPSPA
jgi:hypothetical protein